MGKQQVSYEVTTGKGQTLTYTERADGKGFTVTDDKGEYVGGGDGDTSRAAYGDARRFGGTATRST
jgi:hypothetical protein